MRKMRRAKKWLNVSIAGILLATLLLSLSLQPAYAQASWYSVDWYFRKSVTIINPSADYQTLIRVYYVSGTDISFDAREPDGTGTYTADAGTGVTTIVGQADVGFSAADDYYNGCSVYNITRGLWGTVTDYVGATRTITCSSIAGQVATDTFYFTNIPAAVYLGSRSQADFDDIRFTGSDGVTLLDYWIENQVDSDVAWVWVENDSTPSATCYIYYGNAGAADASDGSATFIFFSDFETVADLAQWTIETVGAGTVARDNTEPSIPFGTWCCKFFAGAGDVAAFLRYGFTPGKDYAVQWYARADQNDQRFQLNAWYDATDPNTRCVIDFAVAGQITYWDSAGIAQNLQAYAADVWYKFETRYNQSADTWDIDIDDVNVVGDAAMRELAAAGNTGISTTEYGNGSWYVDLFIVRNYTDPEPTWESWGTVETRDYPVLNIQNAKVFTDYREPGDWLITVLYTNIYPPYYDSYNVANYFVLQLVNSAGGIRGQVSCPSWDYKPGSIYLSASEVTGLTYGGDFTVRLYGTFSGNPFASYALQPNDWLGSDLTQLDNWVISSAKSLADYYGATMTTYIADRGEVLNEVGAVIFSLGITALTTVRPNLFQIVSTPIAPPTGVFPQAGESATTWQTMFGPDITPRLTEVGNIVGVDGKAIAAWMLIGVMLVLMVWGLPTGHTAPANILAMPILLMGLGLRVFDWATGAVMLVLMVFLLMYNLWFKYG